jgi:uncharacterized UPF0160 family protein
MLPSKTARTMAAMAYSTGPAVTMVESLLGERLRHMLRVNVAGATIVNSMPHEGAVTIGTHDGSFHCDEALAVSMLKLLPSYADAIIVRSRNPAVLSQCSIVVDVGAEYLPATHRYDHHQRGFTEVLEGYNTKLSSAGLVFKHFGKDILRHLLVTTDTAGLDEQAESLVDTCFHKLYTNFIEHIDAIDNGISVLPDPTQTSKYRVSTTLSDRIHWLNPEWNQPVSTTVNIIVGRFINSESYNEQQSPEIFNDRFVMAMVTTCSEFLFNAQSVTSIWWPARSIVANALAERFSVHVSGSIAVLPQSCPWKEHLFELEKEETSSNPVLYVLYQDTGGSWRIQAVPQTPTSFESRKKLPSEWQGLRDEELSAMVGLFRLHILVIV